MRISDWSSDVCSSDLDLVRCGMRHQFAGGHQVVQLLAQVSQLYEEAHANAVRAESFPRRDQFLQRGVLGHRVQDPLTPALRPDPRLHATRLLERGGQPFADHVGADLDRSEHTSELQSLMRISYAVFCLIKK